MNIQFKKGVLTFCVLILTAEQDRYGYELARNLAQRFEVAEGTVYPLLRRLTKEGYFSTYLSESQEGPPRKYYKLTSKGRDHMLEIVKEWHLFVNKVEEIIEEGTFDE